MPLRFIWGVVPEDRGDVLNPASKGSLKLDPTFDISTPDAQEWMLTFCVRLRKQPFYSTTLGPLLSNCFLETFKSWMERRCNDELAGIDRTPCCESSKFPFAKPIFDQCLLEAIGDLYETPTDFWVPGVAGPKFNITNNKVEAMIVEYDSNVLFSYSHVKMSEFYTSVNNWFNDVIDSAPPELRNGFFVSHLKFYDVQNGLSEGTISAIGLAMFIAVLILFLSTFNVALSVISIMTVISIIIVTIGILVILGWKLNILESVAITLTIGLSIDFTLHYGVMYNASKDQDKEANVIYSLTHMAGPVSMAAFTTFLAGVCLLPTHVLAYIQIGTFIIVVMSTSWIFSTFFFQSLLRLIGPERPFLIRQFILKHQSRICCCCYYCCLSKLFRKCTEKNLKVFENSQVLGGTQPQTPMSNYNNGGGSGNGNEKSTGASAAAVVTSNGKMAMSESTITHISCSSMSLHNNHLLFTPTSIVTLGKNYEMTPYGLAISTSIHDASSFGPTESKFLHSDGTATLPHIRSRPNTNNQDPSSAAASGTILKRKDLY